MNRLSLFASETTNESDNQVRFINPRREKRM